MVRIASVLCSCYYFQAAIASIPSAFKASFLSSPTSFVVDADTVFIDETIQRVKLTRLPVDIDQPDFLDGPPVHNATAVRNYWIDHYDWFAVQGRLNEQ
jgi:hypothetical protein